jgi:queuine tRNA-ribosyltransferase
MGENGKLDTKILKVARAAMSGSKPAFALGVGKPQDILVGWRMGYDIFDCVLPTRDARHGRLYVFTADPLKTPLPKLAGHIATIDITKSRFADDRKLVSAWCDCPTCRTYSRSYLHHLFKVNEPLAGRLATMHNLRTYALLIRRLRREGNRVV